MKRMQGGIYLFRANKPYSVIGLPIIGRHNAYTGQSKVYRLRWSQHTSGGGKYKSVAKCWSDLDPEPWRILPLPQWMFDRTPGVVDFLEMLCIFFTAPTYNVQMNKWNPRRISKERAERQRRFRDTSSGGFRLLVWFLRFSVKLLALILLYDLWRIAQ